MTKGFWSSVCLIKKTEPKLQEQYTIQDFILRFLNDPENPELVTEMSRLRAFSDENEAYFQSTLHLWQTAAETGKLKSIDVLESGENFKTQLSEKVTPRTGTRYLWTKIAAAVLVVVAGFWIYTEKTAVNLIVKQTGNQIDSVLLSDGTKIVLAENSAVEYPDRFTGENRPVKLIKGRSFFQVTKDASHPFEISIGHSSVKVLGTSFNIFYSAAKIEVAVKTGRVMFTPNQSSKPAILIAGDAMSYNLVKNQLTHENGINSNGWLTKELHFIDMPLDEVCKQLSAYYDIQVVLEGHASSAKKLNAKFTDTNIDEVLKVLAETYPIQVEKKDTIVYIKNL